MGNDAKHLIKRAWKAIRAKLVTKPWEKKVFYLKHQYPGEITDTNDGVLLNLLGIKLKKGSFPFVIERYDIIRALQTSKSAKFLIRNGLFIIVINDIALNPTTSEELFIIEEIFIHGIYNFESGHRSVVIDIGMNVGIASLFFASREDVEKVYGFEPFGPTHKQALINLKNNNAIQQKINTKPYGLGKEENILTVNYDFAFKGQAGIYGTSLVKSDVVASEKQTIQIKDAAKELQEIIDNHLGFSFVLKVDCEGSEYDIIERLAEVNILSYFKIILIEWHGGGPLSLVKDLSHCGFVCFYQYSVNQKVGMIYASK